ncbi:MAG: hypothetical protein Q9218_004027 [Villophora microphyllina]
MEAMAAPFARGLSRTASKRARSTDSSRSGASTPAPKALKTQDDETSSTGDVGLISVPAFLRQPAREIKDKFMEIEHLQLLRISEGRRDPISRWAQDNTKLTKSRNRYLNVQPWDKSRIHLRVPEGESDYINASPISLTDPRTGNVFSYIASQGPKQTGLSHFWHMVWHQTTDVAVIVMLTQTAEGGREKCYQYFPLDEQTGDIQVDPIERTESALTGTVSLTESHFDEASKSTVRKLLISFGEESKVVWHILFSGWPDFEVPQKDDRAALFELLKLSAEKNTDLSNARIVHCSAGVGRSGSFIALEYLLDQIRSGAIAEVNDGEDPIFEVVNRLREQRMTMVQSDAQFAFLYDVIREQLTASQNSKKTTAILEMIAGNEEDSSSDAHESNIIAQNGHIEEDAKAIGKAPDTL